MTPMSTAVENYHLKWDSHLNYLHLSVAALFKNEKFADVILLPSNSDDGKGIPAHRVILSSCSQFFASIFEINPPPSNGIVYIILPPELSENAVKTLVQYMYSGEATVPNDILREVLRGGEMLKIRGLCRNNIGNVHNNSNTASKSSDLNVSVSKGNLVSGKLPVMESSMQSLTRDSQILPRNVSIKENAKIDSKEICRLSETGSNLVSVQDNGSCNCEVDLGGCVLNKLENDKVRRNSEEVIGSAKSECSVYRHAEQLRRLDRRRTSLPELSKDIMNEKLTESTSSLDENNCDTIPEVLNILTIKKEPIEWHGDPEKEEVLLVKQAVPDIVKTELMCSMEETANVEEDDSDLIYSPLTCELCSETFSVPGDWVHHIENHVDNSSQFNPRKRKRMPGTASEYIASLKCELCSTYFVTPAEWVRHIQNTHTETELAISNNSILPKKKIREMRSDFDRFLSKTCAICSKRFPSYASMIIHRRTHTDSDKNVSKVMRVNAET